MSFLLDTNVVSEWVKKRPDAGVITWLAEIDEDRVFLSVVTLAELRHGIDRLADGNRRRRLDTWLRDELPLRFEGRLLSVDRTVADRWGEVVARREAAGRPIGVMDAFIAATANVHGLKLVTRNESDFRTAVKEIINPWRG
ncbi:type II toxin-antitoxin system VapC family toxin [Vineibacter terrae]|uniref:Ribonuclease VapC n=1 Tax=Vineibacter terrae TaxID=2586908 RepID=A0A5C8P8U2_9HYPH|nr:type II toxin-antitoxin system VapC family toxin [Vineibacter terrae]TXL70217.1 type II toxin-antitoxin system VapC family toxin [Vineibacter terrae]